MAAMAPTETASWPWHRWVVPWMRPPMNSSWTFSSNSRMVHIWRYQPTRRSVPAAVSVIVRLPLPGRWWSRAQEPMSRAPETGDGPVSTSASVPFPVFWRPMVASQVPGVNRDSRARYLGTRRTSHSGRPSTPRSGSPVMKRPSRDKPRPPWRGDHSGVGGRLVCGSADGHRCATVRRNRYRNSRMLRQPDVG